ncbi:hypothetical protein BCR36DRAFT_579772 [Piromyces finnis]|uniref:Protein kinase domain-containing protein n=1 Tax=Piromyces finnis TaxID=1754191 RepID=A0A1Y1VLI0_9FUNG|nr:hypothetical protein BCR36DRAFT_579772 [Piromyces finnis]|eukprot:ORX59143.1 hypothetical protein BCR36DRAFT_579772 [Piromyces finnis]
MQKYWPERRCRDKDSIWIAIDRMTQEEVILKYFPMDTSDDFKVSREAYTMKYLFNEDQKHFLQLYDYIEDHNENQYVIAMEKADCSLEDIVNERKFLTEEEAVPILREILYAIQVMHKNNFIHRDLKLSNILLRNRNDLSSVVIIDFGETMDRTEEYYISGMVGTLHYMAPEILNKKKYYKPVDIWALGVISYRLLTNYFPFTTEEENHSKQLKAILNNDISYIRSDDTRLSDKAIDFINCLLDTDPQNRISIQGALDHPFLNPYFEGEFVPYKPIPKYSNKMNKDNIKEGKGIKRLLTKAVKKSKKQDIVGESERVFKSLFSKNKPEINITESDSENTRDNANTGYNNYSSNTYTQQSNNYNGLNYCGTTYQNDPYVNGTQTINRLQTKHNQNEYIPSYLNVSLSRNNLQKQNRDNYDSAKQLNDYVPPSGNTAGNVNEYVPPSGNTAGNVNEYVPPSGNTAGNVNEYAPPSGNTAGNSIDTYSNTYENNPNNKSNIYNNNNNNNNIRSYEKDEMNKYQEKNSSSGNPSRYDDNQHRRDNSSSSRPRYDDDRNRRDNFSSGRPRYDESQHRRDNSSGSRLRYDDDRNRVDSDDRSRYDDDRNRRNNSSGSCTRYEDDRNRRDYSSERPRYDDDRNRRDYSSERPKYDDDRSKRDYSSSGRPKYDNDRSKRDNSSSGRPRYDESQHRRDNSSGSRPRYEDDRNRRDYSSERPKYDDDRSKRDNSSSGRPRYDESQHRRNNSSGRLPRYEDDRNRRDYSSERPKYDDDRSKRDNSSSGRPRYDESQHRSNNSSGSRPRYEDGLYSHHQRNSSGSHSRNDEEPNDYYKSEKLLNTHNSSTPHSSKRPSPLANSATIKSSDNNNQCNLPSKNKEMKEKEATSKFSKDDQKTKNILPIALKLKIDARPKKLPSAVTQHPSRNSSLFKSNKK